MANKQVLCTVEKDTAGFAVKFSLDGKAAPVKHYPSIALASQAAEGFSAAYGKQIKWEIGPDAMAVWSTKRVGSFTV